MTLDSLDQQLIAIIQDGFKLIEQPFADIAEQLGVAEQVVLDRLASLKEEGTIKRLGVVVRHRELGFKANAMVVWDIPEQHVDEIAQRIASFECVTLCYQRPRRMPDWSYNLFSMIHGKDRDFVLQRLADIVDVLDLQDIKHKPLFSTRQFKQRGAQYFKGDSFINKSSKSNSFINKDFENKAIPLIPLFNKTAITEIIHPDKIPLTINRAYG